MTKTHTLTINGRTVAIERSDANIVRVTGDRDLRLIISATADVWHTALVSLEREQEMLANLRSSHHV